MNACLRTLIFAIGGMALSSCIEFESEVIRYHHDASADELRMTLNYEGISGGVGYKGPADKEPGNPNKLSSRQVEQFESVIKGGRAFFFENWLFEYDRSSIQEFLKTIRKGDVDHDDLVFVEPWKAFLQTVLDHVELTNLGFYLNENQRLSGTQTLVIKDFSNFLEITNEMIRRLVVNRIDKELRKVESGETDEEDGPSPETVALITNACKKKHNFLQIKKGILVVRVPLGKWEYLKFRNGILEKEPDPEEIISETLPLPITGTKSFYEDKMLTLVLGDGKQGINILTKKCHSGYSPNALRYIRKNHPALLRDEAKITSTAKGFLTGGD